MKISTDELGTLINVLTRLKKEQEKRDGMPKDFYAIAKAIRIVRKNLPESNDDRFVREVIQAIAYQITIELVKHNSKFDPDLFLLLVRCEGME